MTTTDQASHPPVTAEDRAFMLQAIHLIRKAGIVDRTGGFAPPQCALQIAGRCSSDVGGRCLFWSPMRAGGDRTWPQPSAACAALQNLVDLFLKGRAVKGLMT